MLLSIFYMTVISVFKPQCDVGGRPIIFFNHARANVVGASAQDPKDIDDVRRSRRGLLEQDSKDTANAEINTDDPGPWSFFCCICPAKVEAPRIIIGVVWCGVVSCAGYSMSARFKAHMLLAH